MSELSTAATHDALPVAPSLDLAVPRRQRLVASRLLFVTGVAIVVGLLAGLVAQVLTALIGLVTNLAFYGRVSFAMVSPADNALGLLVIVAPVPLS